jgi:CheY-like chemotaxis protein
VEDESSIRETVRFALELEGYNVYTASNGQEGIDLLATIPKPCLILLDLMMPVMDGWGFVEAIEKDIVLTKIPVVVVTAFSDKLKTVKARDVIKKPVDLDALTQVAKQWCEPATA